MAVTISPDQQRASQERVNEAKRIKLAYTALAGNLAIIDLLDMLDLRYRNDYNLAVGAVDNPTISLASLQRAHAYDTIRVYLRKQLTQ